MRLTRTMKAFWDNGREYVEGGDPRSLTLAQAIDTWADSDGSKGRFFGLIDEEDRTIQFHVDEDIPDYVEDARHLRIVLVDFPVPERQGSFATRITIGEAAAWIEKAFQVGARHERYAGLTFAPW